MDTLPIIKPDGSIQRRDVELTAAVASALVKRVLEEGRVYADGTEPILLYGVEGHDEPLEVSAYTLRSWLYRGTIVPGEGRSLAQIIEEARVERKRIVREQRQVSMIEIAEQGLAEVVRIPITHGKRTTRRFRRNAETGEMEQSGYSETHTEGVDPELVQAKVKGISFALERLEPVRYGARLSTENKHVVFSLPELRRVKESLDEEAFLKKS